MDMELVNEDLKDFVLRKFLILVDLNNGSIKIG